MTAQKSLLHAIKWSFAGTWGEKLFVVVFTMLLAALLGPQDFGIVSIAWIYINFLQMFLEQGLFAALIQRKELQPEHLDAVFWMNLALAVLLTTISILLSRWWAAVNHAPQVASALSALSFCIPIEALSMVQRALLYKNMDFKGLTIRSNVSVLASGIVGIGMAYGGMGYWSLVGQQLTRDLVSLLLLWKLSPWRPRLAFSWPHLRDLLGFSISNFVGLLGAFADMQAGAILLGLIFGPMAVGLYRLADRVMNVVVAASASAIQAVSLPVFSRFQHQPEELRKSVLQCIRLTATIALPALCAIGATSDALMATLGPKWIPAAMVLRVLCVVGAIAVFTYFTGPLLQALFKPTHLAVLEWARTAVGVGILAGAGLLVRHAGVNVQIMAIAWARLVTVAGLVAPVFIYILLRLSKLSLRSLAGAVAPSAASSAAIFCAIAFVHSLRPISGSRPIVALCVELGAGIIAGAPVLLLLDPELRRAIEHRINLDRVFS
jgi:PST family polysaccharide transporter